jgi:hypothetical protein
MAKEPKDEGTRRPGFKTEIEDAPDVADPHPTPEVSDKTKAEMEAGREAQAAQEEKMKQAIAAEAQAAAAEQKEAKKVDAFPHAAEKKEDKKE